MNRDFLNFKQMVNVWLKDVLMPVEADSADAVERLCEMVSSQPTAWIQENREQIIEWCNKGFGTFSDQIKYLAKCKGKVGKLKDLVLELPPLR